jgi:hypothetical protein
MKFTPDKRGSALERLNRHVALCLENPVNLSTARVHLLGHLGFGNALFVHFLGNLPQEPIPDRLNAGRGAIEDNGYLAQAPAGQKPLKEE